MNFNFLFNERIFFPDGTKIHFRRSHRQQQFVPKSDFGSVGSRFASIFNEKIRFKVTKTYFLVKTEIFGFSSFRTQWIHLASSIVPDDRTQIRVKNIFFGFQRFLSFFQQETLIKLCDELRPNFIFTTGGTGITADDVTPEVVSIFKLFISQIFRQTSPFCSFAVYRFSI